MSRASTTWLLVGALGATGCGRASKSEAAPSASVAPTPAGVPHVISSEQLSSPSAFELAATSTGLHLLWANTRGDAGWLLQAELAHDGALRGQSHSVGIPPHTLGKVTDLAATYLGEQLALAWIEQGTDEARAVATVLTGAAPATLLDLGPAALSAESARGNIAIAAELPRDRALVMWRGLQAPCVEPQPAPCVGFTFRRLRPGAAEPTGLPLSVPVPCASHSVELSVSAGRFHYGVCTREGADPVTTMFSIQYDPEYARAEPLLKGCLPLGTLEVAGRPWLVGDCHGKRKAVPVPLTDEKVQPEYVDALQISCTPERADLRQGRFALALREPRADLQAILPANLLPTGARAGWTGKSLVVAYLAMSRLETRTFACRAGTLQPL
jgi:hypothetical protein